MILLICYVFCEILRDLSMNVSVVIGFKDSDVSHSYASIFGIIQRQNIGKL